jgi:hypothetical protein
MKKVEKKIRDDNDEKRVDVYSPSTGWQCVEAILVQANISISICSGYPLIQAGSIDWAPRHIQPKANWTSSNKSGE